MGLTPQQYEQLLQRPAIAKRNQAGGEGLCSAKPECPEGVSLECVAQREDTGSASFKIMFTVFAVRPLDWDNYRFKDLQDCIVESGLLPDDNWRILQGGVISKKAYSKAEERTEITIERI